MTGRYGLVIMRAIRLAGAATVLALGAFIVVMVRREKRRGSQRSRTSPAPELRAAALICGPAPRSFPSSASTMAGRVDALYFFLLAVSAFFSLLIAGLIVFYAVKYRRRAPDSVGARDPRRPGARDHLDGHPVPHHDGDLRLGRERLLRDVAAAGRDAEHLRRRQAVDVEVPAPRRPARDQRAARAGRPRREADHDLRGRHPRLLRAGVPREGRRHSRAATRSIWFQPTKPGRYHLFCAEYCGTRHSGMIGEVVVMEPSEYQTWLSGGAPEGSLASAGEKLFAGSRVQHLPSPRRAGPRSGARRACSARPSRCRAARRSSVDEAYVRESILNPAAKVAAGFQPIMPTFQGLVSEEQLLELIEYVKSLQEQLCRQVGHGEGSP